MTADSHDEGTSIRDEEADGQPRGATVDWEGRYAWNRYVARSWGWMAPAVVAIAVAAFSLYSWSVLLFAHRPVVDVVVAGTAAVLALTAAVGAGARVLVRGFVPPWRPRRASDSWSVPMIAFAASVAGLALGTIALFAHVGSADVPSNAPLADPATFGDRVTVFDRADGEVTQTSVSLVAVVEGVPSGTREANGEGVCWTVLMDGAVDRYTPGQSLPTDDYSSRWDYFPLVATDLVVDGADTDVVNYGPVDATDCPSTQGWTANPWDPHPQSEISTFTLAFVTPPGVVPQGLVTTDSVGRELHFSFDTSGCLDHERGLDDEGQSAELPSRGCELVVDVEDLERERERNT